MSVRKSAVDYRTRYPGIEGYNLENPIKHNSPCMDSYWRSQPIRAGKKREDYDHDTKPEETEETEKEEEE